jgi:hypothetical protein
MHLVEMEFFRRGDAGEHREMRGNEDDSGDDDAAHHRIGQNGLRLGSCLHETMWHCFTG